VAARIPKTNQTSNPCRQTAFTITPQPSHHMFAQVWMKRVTDADVQKRKQILQARSSRSSASTDAGTASQPAASQPVLWNTANWGWHSAPPQWQADPYFQHRY